MTQQGMTILVSKAHHEVIKHTLPMDLYQLKRSGLVLFKMRLLLSFLY